MIIPVAARSDKVSGAVVLLSGLPEDVQSPAHSFVPLRLPTSRQPIFSFGFACATGLTPIDEVCANATVVKPIAATTNHVLIVSARTIPVAVNLAMPATRSYG
jgi:hypothetical protein